MTTKRLFLLAAVTIGGLSIVFLLPKQLSYQPVGIALQLPEFVGEWFGIDQKVSEREIQVLGPETTFFRKIYTNGRGDEIQASIVLSGQDMNTSIHRPERCLPAQGWTITNKSVQPIQLTGHRAFAVSRLYNVRNITGSDGKMLPLYNLTYYWFVGHRDVTPSHFTRTAIDFRDRLLRGYNQRWAYISIASTVTGNLKKFGRTEHETDLLVADFIKKLVPQTHQASVVF